MHDASNDARALADASTAKCFALRYNTTSSRWEFLNSATDNTQTAWTTWDAAAAVTVFALTVEAADARAFSRTFSFTGGWTHNVVIGLVLAVGGTPYPVVELFLAAGGVGVKNPHSAYGIDPIGLALAGIISQR